MVWQHSRQTYCRLRHPIKKVVRGKVRPFRLQMSCRKISLRHFCADPDRRSQALHSLRRSLSRPATSERIIGSSRWRWIALVASTRRSSCRHRACCSIIASARPSRFRRWRRGYALRIDEAAKLAQCVERKPRDFDHRYCRRGGLGHPRGQQHATAVWLFNHEVDASPVKDAP